MFPNRPVEHRGEVPACSAKSSSGPEGSVAVPIRFWKVSVQFKGSMRSVAGSILASDCFLFAV